MKLQTSFLILFISVQLIYVPKMFSVSIILFGGFVGLYKFEIITPMHVQNSIFNGEVFQIEVSDGLVHCLGSCQTVNLYPAGVFMGARVLRSLYAFRI